MEIRELIEKIVKEMEEKGGLKKLYGLRLAAQMMDIMQRSILWTGNLQQYARR